MLCCQAASELTRVNAYVWMGMGGLADVQDLCANSALNPKT